jgi:ferredoxin
VCTGIAPGFFVLGNDGQLILLEEEVSDAEVAVVRDAALCCPADPQAGADTASILDSRA